MTNEESLYDMLLELLATLEAFNLLEPIAPSNTQAWYGQQKLDQEQDFTPVEMRILDRAKSLKK